MTIRFSTGLRNDILQKKVNNNYSKTHKCSSVQFEISGGAAITNSNGNPEIINNSGDGVDWSTMFADGDQITISGSSSNDTIFTVLAASSGYIEIEKEPTAESGQSCILSVANGGSVKDILRNGILVIFEGSQPASADNDETGYTTLCRITLGGGTFVAGDGENGINFGTASNGKLTKDSSETWTGTNAATGTAGWFRFYGNDEATGADSGSKARFDGNVGTSGADLNVASTSFSSGSATTVGSFYVELPAS